MPQDNQPSWGLAASGASGQISLDVDEATTGEVGPVERAARVLPEAERDHICVHQEGRDVGGYHSGGRRSSRRHCRTEAINSSQVSS
jgi:hypothetical protein